MASIINDPGGKKRIGFTSPDGSRKSLRLGKVPKKDAEFIKFKVEALLSASISGHAVDAETARWVAGLETALADKLSSVGLIAQKEQQSLGEFLHHYMTTRTDLKDLTIRKLRTTRDYLLTYFGESTPLKAISPGHADEWRLHLKAEGKAENTVRKHISVAKQFFQAALRKQLIDCNPFEGLKSSTQPNPARFHFISREVAENVLEACPNAEWRLLFALARFGGLRVPSEPRELRWEHIHWDQNRITVTSPKTAHHVGGESRIIPLFPELQQCLMERSEQAEDGAEFVFSDRIRFHTNPGTTLKKIIIRAGETPWQKLWQNLRSTRQTELEEEFPSHVVCSWIGNSEQVAKAHYLQVTEDHFNLAVVKLNATQASTKGVQVARNATQYGAEPGKTEQNAKYTRKAELPEIPGSSAQNRSVNAQKLAEAGLEPARL